MRDLTYCGSRRLLGRVQTSCLLLRSRWRGGGLLSRLVGPLALGFRWLLPLFFDMCLRVVVFEMERLEGSRDNES